jgi:cell division septation protein DedD
MAENRREKERRFYFTRGQLALLAGTFTVAATVVFVLGMFVGKDIEARKVVRPEEPLVKVPVSPPPTKGMTDGEHGKNRDDLTFYNTLTKTQSAKPAEEKAGGNTTELAEKPASEAPARRASTATQAANAEPAADAKTWSVQVNSYPDAKSANDLIDRLKNKGYNAFVTEANINGKQWYRVRVGRFASRDEAIKAEASLKNSDNFPKAFATRK